MLVSKTIAQFPFLLRRFLFTNIWVGYYERSFLSGSDEEHEIPLTGMISLIVVKRKRLRQQMRLDITCIYDHFVLAYEVNFEYFFKWQWKRNLEPSRIRNVCITMAIRFVIQTLKRIKWTTAWMMSMWLRFYMFINKEYWNRKSASEDEFKLLFYLSYSRLICFFMLFHP